jgi:hypothetical protein
MPLSCTSGDPNAHKLNDATSRLKDATSRLNAAVMRSRAIGKKLKIRAAAVKPHLEQRKADELRNEVTACAHELIVSINETFALGGTLAAMLRMPLSYLCENFAKLANIQNSKRRKFDEHVWKALTRWYCAVFFDTRSGSAGPILVGMKRNLTEVRESLIFGGNLLLNLSLECEKGDTSIAVLVDRFRKFEAVIERALPRGHSRGRPAGVSQHPELDALVFHLELAAQLAGGKFTVHKKNGGKGTIIEALNLLRNVLEANVGTGKKDPATAIPAAAKHPFSTYARAINDARKAAAATPGIAGRGSSPDTGLPESVPPGRAAALADALEGLAR